MSHSDCAVVAELGIDRESHWNVDEPDPSLKAFAKICPVDHNLVDSQRF